MERTMWTDERLDDRFDSIDRDLRELRTDVRELRTLVFQLWGTTMVGFVGTIVTVLVTNS